jgi:hypothetical protein
VTVEEITKIDASIIETQTGNNISINATDVTNSSSSIAAGNDLDINALQTVANYGATVSAWAHYHRTQDGGIGYNSYQRQSLLDAIEDAKVSDAPNWFEASPAATEIFPALFSAGGDLK